VTDAFTLDVIAAGLDAAATEMFEVLRKTAMSPIIYEVLDVGTGITNARGELVSSGAGIPSFIGVLDKSVKAIIEAKTGQIDDGDIFVVNDPNYGGVSHLNDVVVARPVFFDDELVAWAASMAHWGDIGGKTPGSMATDTTEVVAEGLRLPVIKLFEKGVPNKAVFDIIRCNTLLPDALEGDLWAQISAADKAREVIEKLCRRYGTTALDMAIRDAHRVGEARSRAGLATLPKGRVEIEETQDDGSVWCAAIEIESHRFTVDLRDAPKQSNGPYNTGRDGAVVACQNLFKALCDPERFANHGSFIPLRVLTTPGTVFHAGPTAPHAYYFEVRMKLIDMLWHCMAKAMPGKLPQGHFASIFGTVIAGVHPDTQRRYVMVEPQMGGWGATATRRGQHAMFSTNHGDTFNCPVEIAEAHYGFDIVHKSLDIERKSACGKPGGAGVAIAYQLRAPAVLSTGYYHAKEPVWSTDTGCEGGVNSLTVERTDGRIDKMVFASGQAIEAGDTVHIRTARGGGSK
jgi:N-methylhydantoinase B